MYDVSNLKVADILRKDFKKWTRVGKPDSTGSRLMVSHIGMSSIGISIGQLVAHHDTSKLRLLMVVSGYYDSQKNFKREILVSAESVELMRNLLNFFNSNSSQLPLKVQYLPEVSHTPFYADQLSMDMLPSGDTLSVVFIPLLNIEYWF
ncbi:hypothetical protein ACSBR2_013796 [Camellia fascicularis]